MKISCAYTEDNLNLILIELFYYAIKKKKKSKPVLHVSSIKLFYCPATRAFILFLLGMTK